MSYMRQSEQDELNRKIAEQRLSAQMRDEMRRERDYQEGISKRDKVKAGLTELADLDTRMSENDFRKRILEESLQSMPDQMEQIKALTQIKILSKQNEDLERMRGLRSAQLDYEIVDSGMAKAKSIDLVDSRNGLKPQKDTGMATIKRENVIGYDDNNEPLMETISYKVPYTQAVPQPDSGNSGISGFSTYQASNPMAQTTTADQAEREANYIQSYGNMMFQPDQAEISAPAPQAPATTPSQAEPSINPAQVRAEAEAILKNPNIPPDKKEKVRQRAAQYGIQL
jgi:hypothetical protein